MDFIYIQNIESMLKDRKYTILSNKKYEYSLFECEFEKKYIYVIDITKHIKQLLQFIKNNVLNNHYIFITTKNVISTNITNIIHDYELFNFIFFIKNLNAFHLFSKCEKSMYISQYIIPYINLDDPICKWYNFKKNDIIKFYRNDDSLYYRLVS